MLSQHRTHKFSILLDILRSMHVLLADALHISCSCASNVTAALISSSLTSLARFMRFLTKLAIGGSGAAVVGRLLLPYEPEYEKKFNATWQPLYDKWCDRRMRHRKAELLSLMDGKAIELNAGSGVNVRHVPQRIADYIAVEPNEHLHPVITHNADSAGFPKTSVVAATALEYLRSQPAESIHTVLATKALSAQPLEQQDAVVDEIYRVLHPGGKLIFVDYTKHAGGVFGALQAFFSPILSRTRGTAVDKPVLDTVTSRFPIVYAEDWSTNVTDVSEPRADVDIVKAPTIFLDDPLKFFFDSINNQLVRHEIPPVEGRLPLKLAPFVAGVAIKPTPKMTEQERASGIFLLPTKLGSFARVRP